MFVPSVGVVGIIPHLFEQIPSGPFLRFFNEQSRYGLFINVKNKISGITS